MIESTKRVRKSLQAEELRKTYALLFASTSKTLCKKREQIEKDAIKYSIGGLPLKPFKKVERVLTPLHPHEDPLRVLLRPWLDTPCPHHITQIFAHDRLSASGQSYLTIGDVLSQHPGQFPDDLLFQMQGILLFPHKPAGELYTAYPYFGERIRHLNYVLQKQKPRSLKELWRDQRDTLQWWTFWLVVWVGSASLILALLSAVTGIAQTYATFKALPPSSR
jgi:hypothetical protein